MHIQQIYTSCLAEAAYYIDSNGEAAVIDPLRDIDQYIEIAGKRNARIKYIFETHFHADFVSGHIDLARATGATIIYGPGARPRYDIHTASDGEEFRLGSVTMKVLHTPGHTLESSCFLLLDDRGNPHSIFTGDTLFVGDVGRPDLAVSEDVSRDQLAGMLYGSIENKIKTLPSYVVVYPGHGAGSACGKEIGKETHTTIGDQLKFNYALQAKSKEEFVKLVTDGLNDPPKYFFTDARINKEGYRPLDEVLKENQNALSPDDFRSAADEGCVIIDSRNGDEFSKAYIPGSINIGLKGSFAVTVGTVIDPGTPVLVVAGKGKEDETILRLARVGFENVKGYLSGGIENWMDSGGPTDTIRNISPGDFAEKYRYNHFTALDVRNPSEWIPGFVAGARLIPLAKLENESEPVDKDKPCYIYCAGGYRSMVAASLLKKRGYTNVINVLEGMRGIRETDMTLKQLTATTT